MSVRYRKLTALNDYSFGNNQLDFFINDPEAIGQSVESRLLLWLGEWFLDTEEGTPYAQGVLGKYSEALADATIQDRVLSTDGVTSIDNYQSQLNPDTRLLTVQFDLNTIYGPTTVQVANYIVY